MQLGLAVNDDHGNHTGHVAMVEVDNLFQLEGPGAYEEQADTPCSIDNEHPVLTIGERSWPIERYDTWVGNIAWDCAHVRADHVAEIVNYLMWRGDWNCIEAESSLYDKWKRGEPFSAGELAALEV